MNEVMALTIAILCMSPKGQVEQKKCYVETGKCVERIIANAKRESKRKFFGDTKFNLEVCFK